MTLNELFVDVSPWVKLGAYYVAAGAGMVAHWLKSHLSEQTQTKLMGWFFEDYKKTSLTLISVVGTSLPSISSIDLTTASALTMLFTGFSFGFASDSAFNFETPTDNTPK